MTANRGRESIDSGTASDDSGSDRWDVGAGDGEGGGIGAARFDVTTNRRRGFTSSSVESGALVVPPPIVPVDVERVPPIIMRVERGSETAGASAPVGIGGEYSRDSVGDLEEEDGTDAAGSTTCSW